MANAEIVLMTGKVVKIKDLSGGVLVFTFINEDGPARLLLAKLNKLQKEFPDGRLYILGITTEIGASEQTAFRELVKRTGIKFETGIADRAFFTACEKISMFPDAAQTFVVRNGRLRGIFTGTSTITDKQMIEFVHQILNGS